MPKIRWVREQTVKKILSALLLAKGSPVTGMACRWACWEERDGRGLREGRPKTTTFQFWLQSQPGSPVPLWGHRAGATSQCIPLVNWNNLFQHSESRCELQQQCLGYFDSSRDSAQGPRHLCKVRWKSLTLKSIQQGQPSKLIKQCCSQHSYTYILYVPVLLKSRSPRPVPLPVIKHLNSFHFLQWFLLPIFRKYITPSSSSGLQVIDHSSFTTIFWNIEAKYWIIINVRMENVIQTQPGCCSLHSPYTCQSNLHQE